MLSIPRSANGHIDWDTVLFGRLWPVVVIAGAASWGLLKAADPDYFARVCMPAVSTAPSAHFECKGKTFDRALELYLAQSPSLEAASVNAFSFDGFFGPKVEGYVVLFREKTK